MKIHCIQTGRVKIKQNQLRKAKGAGPKLAKVFFDRQWSDWLPIYAWVIEHEEGILVVDTGETHKTGIKGYLPQWHPYYSLAVDFDVRPQDEIGPQLARMGIDAGHDVEKVILTHLHTDHAGGLYHFPNAEIYMEKKEYLTAKGIKGIAGGYLPNRWPGWLEPKLLDLPDQPYGPFRNSLAITRDGSVRIVSTPGHVPRHMSVIVKNDGLYYFLAGDSSYTEENMVKGIPDGIGIAESVETLRRIRAFASDHPTVYLPSHDPDSAERLSKKTIVPIYRKEYITA